MPPEQATRDAGLVIVGVDDSDRSRDALAVGQALIGRGERLLIVYVCPFRELAGCSPTGTTSG